VTPADQRSWCDRWTPSKTSPPHGLAASDLKDAAVRVMSLHLRHQRPPPTVRGTSSCSPQCAAADLPLPPRLVMRGSLRESMANCATRAQTPLLAMLAAKPSDRRAMASARGRSPSHRRRAKLFATSSAKRLPCHCSSPRLPSSSSARPRDLCAFTLIAPIPSSWSLTSHRTRRQRSACGEEEAAIDLGTPAMMPSMTYWQSPA
jgi:hypothetical protein